MLPEPLKRRRPGRDKHLEASFIVQRRGMALLAFAFPLVFILSSLFHWTKWRLSISAYYYYTVADGYIASELVRNFFIGALCAIGVFLLLYKGYTVAEDWILNIAGVAAVGIAFFAMIENSDCAPGDFFSTSNLHSVCAVIFFACIAYVCIVMAGKSLDDEPDTGRRDRFLFGYRACAFFMAVAVAAALVIKLAPFEWANKLCYKGGTLWCEAVAVWAFAAFWFIKTRELEPVRRRMRARVEQGAADPQTLAA